MQRGNQTLFQGIFEDTVPKVKTGKGRNSNLNAKRNEQLVDRYYYYGKFYETRYTAILSKLENEFHISSVTVVEVITANHAMLRNLKTLQPSIKYFKEKWPHWVW